MSERQAIQKRSYVHFAWIEMIACAMIVGGGCGLCINCIGVVFNAVADDVGFSSSQLSMYYTIRALSGALMVRLFVRCFQQKEGHRWVGLLCLATSLSIGILAFCTEIWQWYLAAFFPGIALTGLYAVIPIVVTNWFDSYRGTVLGVVFSVTGIVSVFGNPLVSKLLIAFGWRSTCLMLMAAIFVLTVPVSFLVLRKTPEEIGLKPFGTKPEKMYVGEAKEADELPASMLKLCIIYILLCTVPLSFTNELAFFAQSIGFGLEETAILISFCMIGNLLGKLAVGLLNDKIGIFYTLGCIMLFVGMAAGLFLIDEGASQLTYFGGALFGATYTILTSNSLLIMEVYGKKRYPFVWPRLSSISGITAAVMTYLLAMSYDVFGTFRLALWMLFAAAVSAIGMIFMIRRLLKKSM